MDKLIKFLGVPNIIGGLIFLILGLFILIQWSCNKNKENSQPNGGIVDSYIKLDADKLVLEIHEVTSSLPSAEITRMPTNEYVKDNIGLYYSIDLKDSDSPSPTVILFPPGEYSYKDNDWKFNKSLAMVEEKFFNRTLKNVTYKIFIEGQADKAGDMNFTRNFLPNYTYKKIEYYTTYKSNTATKIFYDSKPTTITLTEPLKNADLPLLRASYLSEKLMTYGNLPKPIILEGEVKDKVGAEYRNGTIILFIDTTQN